MQNRQWDRRFIACCFRAIFRRPGVWGSGALVAYDIGNVTDYRIDASDLTGLGDYAADMPAAPAGGYNFQFVDAFKRGKGGRRD